MKRVMCRLDRGRRWRRLVGLAIVVSAGECRVALEHQLIGAIDAHPRVRQDQIPRPVDPGERINKDADELAILGYDTVAYFTDERPVKGSPDFEYVWQDARWRFASAEHRTLFTGDPDRYAPQFGGFCTDGVGEGHLSSIDPEAWVIVDGRLYLHYDKEARDDTAAAPEPRIAAAAERWEALGKSP